LSLLRRAYDHHRDLRTPLPAAALAPPIDRVRQLMTLTPPSPSPLTPSLPPRPLTCTRPPSPPATLTPAPGRQNLQHRIPHHQAGRTQGGQGKRPAGQSTIVLSGPDKSDQAAAANSP